MTPVALPCGHPRDAAYQLADGAEGCRICYQAELRALHSARRSEANNVTEPEPAKRMTLSHIVELLLTKAGHDRSSVTLSRNAKGETQIEVVVRTGDSSEVSDVLEAEQRAGDVYDRLRAKYPLATGYVGATKPADAGKPSKGTDDGGQA